jgi:pimeloyl-ACP methyl ester carboxylesterase
MDLPGDEPEATFSDYANVVDRALGDVEDDVVLVGHSTGRLTIPLVAARRPVKELVILCGVIPVPGESAAARGIDWRVIEPAEWQVDNGDGSFSIAPRASVNAWRPTPTRRSSPGSHSPMASRPRELADLLLA